MLACMAIGLGACSSDAWLGAKEAPPLPGVRISVLEHERRLQPAKNAAQVAIRLPEAKANSAWPQAGGNSRHVMQHMQMNDTPQKLWETNVGSGSNSRNRLMGGPIVADGKIFAIDTAARVTALDAETGAALWSSSLAPEYEKDDSLLGGGLAYEDGKIVATTGFAQVVALESNTGRELWRTSVTAPMRAAPTLGGGRAFVVTVDNKGLALSLDDGRILWTHASVEEPTSLLLGAAPALDKGVVVMAYTSGEIDALRVDNGISLWSDSVIASRRTDASANLSDIGASPVISGNRVFVVGHSGLMTAIDMRTGDRAWEVELSAISQPWVVDHYLFVVTSDAQVVALDGNNGQVLWVSQLAQWTDPTEKTGRVIWSAPTLASDRLIVTGSDGELLFVNPHNGHVLGRVDMNSAITFSPALANKTLYFLTEKADVVAFR